MADETKLEAPEQTPEQRLEGIGGWLLIPFLGLLFGAFQHSSVVFEHELPRAALEILVGNAVLALGSIVLFTLMCLRHSMVPMLIVVYAVTDIAFHGLEYVAVATYLAETHAELAAREAPRVLEELRMTLAFWIVFVPYFFVSKRVKNTFVND